MCHKTTIDFTTEELMMIQQAMSATYLEPQIHPIEPEVFGSINKKIREATIISLNKNIADLKENIKKLDKKDPRQE